MTNALRRGLRNATKWGNAVFFWAVWLFGVFLLKLYFRFSSENRPRLQGNFIVAANHASLLDGVVLQGALPRRISYLLTVSFYRKRALRWFFRLLHTIPVQEGGGNRQALLKASEYLAKGHVVGIFPEGGLSQDGKPQKGQTGIAALAESAQVPVVPAAILGSFEAMPRGSFFPRPRKIRIRFGEPISPPPRSDEPRRERYQQYADRVMQAIAALQAL